MGPPVQMPQQGMANQNQNLPQPQSQGQGQGLGLAHMQPPVQGSIQGPNQPQQPQLNSGQAQLATMDEEALMRAALALGNTINTSEVSITFI